VVVRVCFACFVVESLGFSKDFALRLLGWDIRADPPILLGQENRRPDRISVMVRAWQFEVLVVSGVPDRWAPHRLLAAAKRGAR